MREWWDGVLNRLVSSDWATDVGLPTLVTVFSVITAAIFVRHQLGHDTRMAQDALNHEEAQVIGQQLIDLGRRLGGGEDLSLTARPDVSDEIWGANRFPGSSVVQEIWYSRLEVREACQRLVWFLGIAERAWYCLRSPLPPRDAAVTDDEWASYYDAWVASRAIGFQSMAQAMHRYGRFLRAWDGRRPWRLSEVEDTLLGSALLAYGGRPAERNQIRMHRGRTEARLQEAGLERLVVDQTWPQEGERGIDRQVSSAMFWRD